jgi:GntP family gluconate:H+ symporter
MNPYSLWSPIASFTSASTDLPLLGLALGAIVLLVLLVTRWKLNPFLALSLAALALGGGAVGLGITAKSHPGAPWTVLQVVDDFKLGLGSTLGGVASLICLGAILGKLLSESGGAGVLAKGFMQFFGKNNAGWCIIALAVTVGLSSWFAVGFLLLLPVLLSLTKETGRPFLNLALPLLSFLSVMHGVMPPHPGPVIAINALHADTGKVLLWGFLIGIPTAAIAGPAFAKIAVKRVHPTPPVLAREHPPQVRTPGFLLTLFSILLPIALMLVGTCAELLGVKESLGGKIALTIGSPVIAMLTGVLFCLWSLGIRCGWTSAQLLQFTEQSINAIGVTFLTVGAGGGFARVLTESGVARILGELASQAHLPILLYGWLVSAFIRVATGSATVAITVAADLLVPLLAASPGTSPELLVVAIGCGSLFLSHLNDAGFWIVRDCLGLSVRETLQTWTITETLIGVAGLLISMAVEALRHSLG